MQVHEELIIWMIRRMVRKELGVDESGNGALLDGMSLTLLQ